MQGAHNILDYGAVAGSEENTTNAFANADAMTQAIIAANSSAEGDRTVLIPQGSNFVMMPIKIAELNNIDFQIDGNVYASQDYQNWNFSGGCYWSFWEINDSQNLTFTGTGLVDGQGYWWWMREYLILNKGRRPYLVVMNRVKGAYFSGVKWQNSPSYHLKFDDVEDFVLENFEIYVDAFQQQKL